MFGGSLLDLSSLCLHTYPNVFRTYVEIGDVKTVSYRKFLLGFSELH